MIPSSALCRLASLAVQAFSAPATAASSPLSSAHEFPRLVSCTRSLVLLTKTSSGCAEDAHLLRCLRQCADHTLDALCQLPPSAGVCPDVSVILFGILRSSVTFWESEKSAQLVQQLNDRVDPLVLRTWRPSVLLAAVHAIAKACPSQTHLSFLSDALAMLHHQEAQLSERDVATLLWCLAVLRVAETQARMWASLCKRATLQYTRMNSVSRLTLTQALLLQYVCLCESQAELLRVVHETNSELERYSESADDVGSSFSKSGSRLGGQRKRRTAHFYSGSNSRADAPSLLTSQLLQYVTHTLSDEALVRLLITLCSSNAKSADELLLVLAHLTQRTSLPERLCVQVLCFVQQYATFIGDNAAPLTDASNSPSLLSSGKVSALMRQARRHVTKLLVRAARSGLVQAPREVVEALCLEHFYYHRDSRDRFAYTHASKAKLPADAVWDAIVVVLSTTLNRDATTLHNLGGAELWSWQCIRAYVKSVEDAASTDNGSAPDASSLTQRETNHKVNARDLHSDELWCWPNTRERQGHCADLIIASAESSATQLLTYAMDSHRFALLNLLQACVQELHTRAGTLSVATTLRLLSAVDKAIPAISPILHTLQPFLLLQLEGHTAQKPGAMPDMIQYLSYALAREVGYSYSSGKSNNSRNVENFSVHPRVSDAVLDIYVGLLTQEHQRTLPAVQLNLLMRCLQERQSRPASLENAFMMLMTRRFGQSVAFLNSTTLPAEAMCGLVELADGLPRADEDATATATRSLILSTLLDILVQRCIPACTSADGLVAAGLLLRLDVMKEFQRVEEIAAALDKRGAELLKNTTLWTSTQKAYLVAALVCAQKEPSQELLLALHGVDPLPTSTASAE